MTIGDGLLTLNPVADYGAHSFIYPFSHSLAISRNIAPATGRSVSRNTVVFGLHKTGRYSVRDTNVSNIQTDCRINHYVHYLSRVVTVLSHLD